MKADMNRRGTFESVRETQPFWWECFVLLVHHGAATDFHFCCRGPRKFTVVFSDLYEKEPPRETIYDLLKYSLVAAWFLTFAAVGCPHGEVEFADTSLLCLLTKELWIDLLWERLEIVSRVLMERKWRERGARWNAAGGHFCESLCSDERGFHRNASPECVAGKRLYKI